MKRITATPNLWRSTQGKLPGQSAERSNSSDDGVQDSLPDGPASQIVWLWHSGDKRPALARLSGLKDFRRRTPAPSPRRGECLALACRGRDRPWCAQDARGQQTSFADDGYLSC